MVHWRKKGLWTLLLLVILWLAWAVFLGGPLTRGYAELLFRRERAAFDTAAAQAAVQESGAGVSCPLGVRKVTFWDHGETAVDFSLGAWGLGGGTRYWGVQYVPSGALLGYQGAALEGWTPEGEGWLWEEDGGDNRCYVQALDEGWYYYEMAF